ncbi:MAG: cation diffusion facilitator family transporter [Pirellulales bacterium]|nr:cation diffusion facilitator family transporter [Pirellulales bacterium]
MAHSHHHHADFNRAFAIGIVLNVIYIIIEIAFGLMFNSLALLADASHNISDVLSLIMAWVAHYLTRLPPTERRTFGWKSSSILAALFNALILLVAIGGIIWEAIGRLINPIEVSGLTVVWVSMVGVVINTLTALLFFTGRKHDLNIKGAFLHMAADAAVSMGVVIAGLIIFLTGAAWVDPLTSLLVAVVILIGTWGLLRDSAHLALQGVPREIDLQEVRNYLAQLPGVTGVHDIHVWAMSTTEIALTAHLVRPEVQDNDALLMEVSRELDDRFGIEYSTVQIERSIECRAARHCSA